MASNEPESTAARDGHYIAKWDRAKCMEISRPGVKESEVWVPAEMFMETQKERDDFRRALGFISAWRAAGSMRISALDGILLNAGFDLDGGRAILGIIQWSRENQQGPANRAEGDRLGNARVGDLGNP